MKANPGGQLAVDEIVGRDALCDLIRETLVKQSVIMTAERRIGKTSVMKILEEKPEKNWVPIYIDLEKVSNAKSFADVIYKAVQKYLSGIARAENIAKALYQSLGGAEGGGFKLPESSEKTWQEILEASILTLTKEQSESGKQVLFLWDEVPYMITNICQHDGEEIAKHVLDTLRALRRECDNFRILITGSVGIHHVLKVLQKSGYKNEPFNDMYNIEVRPLEHEFACELAKKLLQGEGISTDNIELVAGEIAVQTDNFPFYIQSVVKSLKSVQSPVTQESVKKMVLQNLVDDNDPWELRHYDKRIGDYYSGDEMLIRIILDELAVSKQGLSPKQLLSIIKQRLAFDDIEKLRALLRDLNKDHYLSKISNQYSFRFTLIQRWWCLDRELTENEIVK